MTRTGLTFRALSNQTWPTHDPTPKKNKIKNSCHSCHISARVPTTPLPFSCPLEIVKSQPSPTHPRSQSHLLLLFLLLLLLPKKQFLQSVLARSLPVRRNVSEKSLLQKGIFRSLLLFLQPEAFVGASRKPSAAEVERVPEKRRWGGRGRWSWSVVRGWMVEYASGTAWRYHWASRIERGEMAASKGCCGLRLRLQEVERCYESRCEAAAAEREDHFSFFPQTGLLGFSFLFFFFFSIWSIFDFAIWARCICLVRRIWGFFLLDLVEILFWLLLLQISSFLPFEVLFFRS